MPRVIQRRAAAAAPEKITKTIKMMDGFCPVFGKTTNRTIIRRWRVWILWSDGDHTAELMSNLAPGAKENAEVLFRTEPVVYPWPTGTSKKAVEQRKLLRQANMKPYVPQGGEKWDMMPMNEFNAEDGIDGLPEEKDAWHQVTSDDLPLTNLLDRRRNVSEIIEEDSDDDSEDDSESEEDMV